PGTLLLGLQITPIDASLMRNCRTPLPAIAVGLPLAKTYEISGLGVGTDCPIPAEPRHASMAAMTLPSRHFKLR
ncbi:MAG: hypothetical protein ACP5O7_12650, partial [Phycisphaerae bacterium]